MHSDNIFIWMRNLELLATSNKKYNGWLYFPEYYLNIYLRITKRYINGTFHNSIDLATISVDEDCRNQGHFTRFLNHVEQVADKSGRIVYIESIVNKQFKKFLLKSGYSECYLNENSVFKII